jgi:hypothetical protein
MTDSEEGFRKLYLPKWCLIPEEVKNDKGLSSDEKIFFGELNVLANERDYCWGSNEEFAEIKGTSLSTVKRWFNNLEITGHIRRETVSVRYKNEDNEKKSWLWKKDRKIWVGKGVSKNSSDRSKSEPFNDRSKSEPFNDRSKSEPILKGKEKKREKKTTTEESPEINPPKPKPKPSSSSSDYCVKKEAAIKHLPLTIQTKYNLQRFSLEILTYAAAEKQPKNMDSLDRWFFALCNRLEDGTQSMEKKSSSTEATVASVKSTLQDMFKEVEFPAEHEIKFIKGGYHLFKDGFPAATVGYGQADWLEKTEKIIKYLKEQNDKR